MLDGVVEPTGEDIALAPKFKPGDICLCAFDWPGIITHHAYEREREDVVIDGKKFIKIKTMLVYKGYHLAVEQGHRPWESRDPKLLLSLGKHYHKG